MTLPDQKRKVKVDQSQKLGDTKNQWQQHLLARDSGSSSKNSVAAAAPATSTSSPSLLLRKMKKRLACNGPTVSRSRRPLPPLLLLSHHHHQRYPQPSLLVFGRLFVPGDFCSKVTSILLQTLYTVTTVITQNCKRVCVFSHSQLGGGGAMRTKLYMYQRNIRFPFIITTCSMLYGQNVNQISSHRT